jgi:hypothetical protein
MIELGTVKISELPQITDPSGMYFAGVKGGTTVKLNESDLTNHIKKEVADLMLNMYVPNIELDIRGNMLCYKIANLEIDKMKDIIDTVNIGLVRYKRYNRRNGNRGVGAKWEIGRKWTFVNDSTSKYVRKNEGDNVAAMKQEIFWTNVKIEPEKMNEDSYFEFTPYIYSPENLMSRFTYFVENRGTPNERLSSFRAASIKSFSPNTNIEDIEDMFKVTGKTSKIKFLKTPVGFNHLFYSMNFGLVAYRNVDIPGIGNRRVFGNIVPFRVCCHSQPKTGNTDFKFIFKRLKK